MIDKNAFLAYTDSETDTVNTPEWPSYPVVTVRNLTGHEQERWQRLAKKLKDDGTESGFSLQCLACVMGIVNAEDGSPVFTDEDAEALGKKHPKVIDRIAEKIYSLTAMTSHERAEIEKKASTSPTSGSGST